MTRAADEVASAASSYEVLALLATGGMAEIYLARGASVAGVERYVVLKRILRDKATDASFVEMFLEEARLAAQLQHPNVAQVYDIGKLGESFFFTMEYVHGETLRAMLQRSTTIGKPIPTGCVLAIASGAAAGLHHAHARRGIDGKPLGIVHRDVSPSNLMVSFEGTVKLVDFGVAKATQRTYETRSGTVKGKISYLSPEQCRGHDLDRRSDLFSLGIVLWETIALERLFRRGTDFETMNAIVRDEPPRLTSLRPDVLPELDDLVQKLLAKAPEARYQTGDELQHDIDQIAVQAGVSPSAAGLSRFVRDLFGVRPEPWVALRDMEGYVGPETVTNAPRPATDPLASDPVEQALAQVIDLAGQKFNEPRISEPRVAAPTLASRQEKFRTVKLDLRNQDVLPTARMRAESTGPLYPSATGLIEPTSPDAEHLAPPSYRPAMAPITTMPPMVAAPWAAPDKTRSRITIVAAVVLVVGAAIAMFAALGHRNEREVSPSNGSSIVMAPISAGSGSSVSPRTDGAGSATAGSATTGSAVEPAAATAPRPRIVTDVAGRERIPAVEPKPAQLASAIQNGRFADASALCRADTRLAASQAESCVIAACRTHDADHARKWLASVRKRRGSILETCRGAGTPLDVRVPTGGATGSNACADPFACQH